SKETKVFFITAPTPFKSYRDELNNQTSHRVHHAAPANTANLHPVKYTASCVPKSVLPMIFFEEMFGRRSKRQKVTESLGSLLAPNTAYAFEAGHPISCFFCKNCLLPCKIPYFCGSVSGGSEQTKTRARRMVSETILRAHWREAQVCAQRFPASRV